MPTDGASSDPAAASAEFHMAPVKAPSRVYLKLLRSYNGDWSQVCDIIRCSAVYGTLPELADALERLMADPVIAILQVKTRLFPSPSRFQYIHTTARANHCQD